MFDIARLETVCRMRVDEFASYGECVPTPGGNYVFRDVGSQVLAVAHLDTVLPGTHFARDGDRVASPTLDDRLGVYLLAHLLPAFGVECDLLLTDGEEVGRSTARWFVPPRRYNWIFSFDRAGTDVVLYQYDAPECRRLLGRAGFRVGAGSSSDIAHLGFLGCKGFNFGCGYYRQHQRECFAVLRETERMVTGFVRFWRRHARTFLAHSDRTR